MKLQELLEGGASVSGDSFEAPLFHDDPEYADYQNMMTKHRRKKLSKKRKNPRCKIIYFTL